MKKILIIVVLFAALGTTTTQAQNRQTPTVWGANDGTVYSDDRGEYQWEMRERRVWVPEQRTRGILGVGSRTIPGHYEMRTERVRVYNDSKNNKKGHPHGMPPGQRKKMDKRDDDRYDSRDRRYDDSRDRDDDRRDRDDDRRDKRYDNRRDRDDDNDRD